MSRPLHDIATIVDRVATRAEELIDDGKSMVAAALERIQAVEPAKVKVIADTAADLCERLARFLRSCDAR